MGNGTNLPDSIQDPGQGITGINSTLSGTRAVTSQNFTNSQATAIMSNNSSQQDLLIPTQLVNSNVDPSILHENLQTVLTLPPVAPPPIGTSPAPTLPPSTSPGNSTSPAPTLPPSTSPSNDMQQVPIVITSSNPGNSTAQGPTLPVDQPPGTTNAQAPITIASSSPGTSNVKSPLTVPVEQAPHADISNTTANAGAGIAGEIHNISGSEQTWGDPHIKDLTNGKVSEFTTTQQAFVGPNYVVVESASSPKTPVNEVKVIDIGSGTETTYNRQGQVLNSTMDSFQVLQDYNAVLKNPDIPKDILGAPSKSVSTPTNGTKTVQLSDGTTIVFGLPSEAIDILRPNPEIAAL